MEMEKFDFSGWATKANLKCSDGRVILKDAFKDNDGKTVPLVWNHQHNEAFNVLGHALLENRDEGIYAYCKFNETESGKNAKLLVEHGDVSALSIYANQLKQQGSNVLHGAIREVSLVLAGANPGAFIDSVIKHDDESNEEAIIYTGENLSLNHSSDDEVTEEEIDNGVEEVEEVEKKEEEVIQHASEDNQTEENRESSDETEDDEKKETVADVYDSLSDKQKEVVHYMLGQLIDGDDEAENEEKEDSKGGNDTMKHNVFEQEEQKQENVLSHSDMQAIIADAKRYGSMKESAIQHEQESNILYHAATDASGASITYGMANVDYLFPEARSLNTPPSFISRDMGWVKKVMGGTHHTPFSRIKSMFADITEDDARAKGYIKGKLKKEEVFTLLKRTTVPTTIYKKQKMDRDDVIDITDFDVIAWLKSEMRLMLDEEIARAILVGDGRLASSDDKINETNIRPIWTDDDLYTIKSAVNVASSATADEKAKAFIRAAVKSRKDYKGSGNPVLFTTEDVLTDCLLMEDNMGRVIYDSVEKLATAMRVREIVTVPVMENLTRTDSDSKTRALMGIIVNLADYNVGADKGGAINMFDDFDIDYNQQKYLIETRCSGALIKPYSAIALELVTDASAG